MLTFALRALVVSGLVTAAGFLLERALRHLQRGGRHAWTLSLFASVLLPFVPRLIASSQAPVIIPAITVPVLELDATAAAPAINYWLYAWLLLSAATAIVYAVAYVRLQGARREWNAAELAGQPVFISQYFGPAVFGFIRARIVVPEWVRTTSQEEQRLIVLHEREHINAWDQLLLLLVVAGTVCMPWNPFIWLQARRLRFALEADCDQRVLRDQWSEAGRYAQLLVDVGGRQKGLLVAAALAEHRNGLERRIGMIATRIAHNWWKAAALAVVSVGIGVVACESRLPSEPRQPQPSNTTGVPRPVNTEQPEFTAYTQMPMLTNRLEIQDKLVRSYPAELKSRGVGGTSLVWVLISETGAVLNTKIGTSSGEAAIDQAALEVTRAMQFTPALNRDAPVKAWIALPIKFTVADKPVGAETIKTDQPKAAPKPFSRDEPSFSPFTQEPVLVNRQEITQKLVESYPADVRDQKIGGTTLVWILIGENGSVEKASVKTTSGKEALDKAAVEVARTMRFSPALNRDKPVATWIALPIKFAVH